MTRIARWMTLPLVCSALATAVPGVQAQTALLEVEKADATRIMQVNEDGGLVVKGAATGTIPATGTGTRLMWHPAKAAFRAGSVVSNNWDEANIGFGSVAMGGSTTASGDRSTALGSTTVASGSGSTALGADTKATGGISTALGDRTVASGNSSMAMGSVTTASSGSSTAMGSVTTASGLVSTAMGSRTTASGLASTAAGSATTASGDYSTAMGSGTVASGLIATAIGVNAKATGNNTIALGAGTTAAGNESTAMGSRTTALGAYSTAMGSYASAFGSGSFAFGDRSTSALVTAFNDQFVVRASGGFRFRTSPNLSTGCDLQTGSGTWSCTSSRLAKERFENVSGEEVLHRLRRLSIQRWSYLGLDTRHLGPVAEEFYAAFGLGEGPTTIATVDADGVGLLAIQALERRTAELQDDNAALRRRLEELEARCAEASK